LRALTSLLRFAGKKRRQSPNIILLMAMKDMNIAKLTSADLPLFNGIVQDLFPAVETPVIEYDTVLIGKYDFLLLGKTITWKILQQSLTALNQKGEPDFEIFVYYKIYPLNPKSMSLGELYGETDLSTNEWSDGVLSSLMRTACTPDEKWILFDGPVDTLWIESMNSVMDDNKVLTLINGERISMPEQVSLLFEVENLAMASPATVSRCGMVYNDYVDLGWKPFVQSWLEKRDTVPL
uniref:Dynein heavy chain hydrolytic ATP-binding dynein motor region domain-containing protein n=1 Tax=Xiphophorus maculatus TaxID=8083 RepID=A0A3B5R8Q1_XIPMA